MAAQAKRHSGYAITIHGFIAIPKNDLDMQSKVPAALKEAIDKNDIAGIVAMMKLDPDGVTQKYLTRNNPHPELAGQAGPAQTSLLDPPAGAADDAKTAGAAGAARATGRKAA